MTKTPISIRMDPELLHALTQWAKVFRMSRSDLIEKYCREALSVKMAFHGPWAGFKGWIAANPEMTRRDVRLVISIREEDVTAEKEMDRRIQKGGGRMGRVRGKKCERLRKMEQESGNRESGVEGAES